MGFFWELDRINVISDVFQPILTGIELLEAAISIILTACLTVLFLSLYLRRTIPLILTDVAEEITEQLGAIVEKPAVKQAMSLMGKKSGEVRAGDALREKAADAIMGQSPVISRILTELDITPLEGLELFNDPLFGPVIKGFIQKGLGGLIKANPEGGPSEYRSEF